MMQFRTGACPACARSTIAFNKWKLRKYDWTLENIGNASAVACHGCPLCVGVCLGSFITLWPCSWNILSQRKRHWGWRGDQDVALPLRVSPSSTDLHCSLVPLWMKKLSRMERCLEFQASKADRNSQRMVFMQPCFHPSKVCFPTP